MLQAKLEMETSANGHHGSNMSKYGQKLKFFRKVVRTSFLRQGFKMSNFRKIKKGRGHFVMFTNV